MVYITSALFGPTTTHDREHSLVTTYWPAMANTQHAAGLGKRKRPNDEDRHNTHLPCHHRLPPSNREPIRSHHAPPVESNDCPSYMLSSTTTSNITSERRPFKQMKRLSSKAALVKSTSHLMDIELDLPPNSKHSEAPAHAASDLRPCHACKLAPKRRKDLENYLDCTRCDGRTCYICARQCQGGCRKAVCKKCIVEVGQEGDAWCLDCYSQHLNS